MVRAATAVGSPLFVYGTLLFPEVLHLLLGRDPARRSAGLTGWRAVALPGVPYPGLVADPAGTVTGDLLGDLTAAEWDVLDAYEDAFYLLVEVTTDAGDRAWTYALPAAATDQRPWDRDGFAAWHLRTFLAEVQPWRREHDRSGAHRVPPPPG